MFGIYTIKDLNSCIIGYKIALQTYKIEDGEVEHFFGFNNFLFEKNRVASAENWTTAVENFAESEENRFILFKDWLEEYKRQVPICKIQ